MALHLCLSNALEKLADEFMGKLCRPMAGQDPFAPVHTVIANAGMGAFLKRHLAKRNNMGIAGNLECTYLQQFISGSMEKFFSPEQQKLFRKSVNFWSPEVLSWRIDALLDSEQQNYPDLTAYWAGDPMKRHLLSCELARCFDRYQLYRSSCLRSSKILSEWREGKYGHSVQGRLYNRLCDFVPDPDYFYLEFFSIASPVRPLPEKVGVFSISSMSALHLHCLKKMASHSDIYLFCPSPCQVYWGDMKSRRETLNELKKSPDRIAGILDEAASGNQLLADFGVVGREFFNLLLDEDCFSGAAEEELFTDPGTLENPSALQIFQSDILNARVRDEKNIFTPGENDDSIRINCCSDSRRELEILHDQLLAEFYGRSKPENDGKSFKVTPALRPEDVIVMFPDINKAAPMIDAVFSAGPFKGKYAICDRSTIGQSQVIECFSRLLALPEGRCTSEEILELLEFECLSSGLGIESTELPEMAGLVARVRISWGLDEKEHRRFRQNDFREFSWQDGIDRLLTEYATGNDASVIYEPGETGGIDGRTAELAGIIAGFVTMLKEWRSALYLPRTPGSWGEFMHTWIGNFFSGSSREYLPELASLRMAVSKIVRNAAAADEKALIPPEVFIARLSSEYSLTGGKQHFLRDKITFCSLVPLRAVPAKIIAVLGLNDGEFPGVYTPKSFDLLKTVQRNDPQLTNDGRYLFLEALMAAREKLILSYVGFADGRELAPAIPMVAVENVLKNGFGIEKDRIPLKQLEHGSLGKYRLSSRNRNCVPQVSPEPVPFPETMSISLLQQFLCRQSEAFFKLRYGFDYAPEEKTQLMTDDPDSLSPLDESKLLRALLNMHIAAIPPGEWLSRVEKARLLPVNGQDLFDRGRTLVAGIPEKVADQLRKQIPLKCSCSLNAAGHPLQLYGTLEYPVLSDPETELRRTVLLCSSAAPEKLLRAYLEHLLLSSAFPGRQVTGTLIFLKDRKCYEFPLLADAQEKLESLVSIALESYVADKPLPVFANASFSSAAEKTDTLSRFINYDMKYSSAVGLFFSKEDLMQESFQDLALKIYFPVAKLEERSLDEYR